MSRPHRRSRRRKTAILLSLGAVAAAAGLWLPISGAGWQRAGRILVDEGAEGLYLRARGLLPVSGLRIVEISPELGDRDAAVRTFVDDLGRRNTNALIVQRHGRILVEAYAPDWGPHRPHGIAAMGKAATAAVIAMAMVDDGYVDLDDPVSDYIPQLRADPGRSAITIRHILTHSSGLDDVDFTAHNEGWKRRYLQNPGRRHEMAARDAPLLFAPGTDTRYSGVGFYVLARALAAALPQADGPGDLRTLLRDRIMRRLDIPDEAWRISYGTQYELDGRIMHSIGSGGTYAPRALATIGQLLVDGGSWNGTQVLDSTVVSSFLRYGGSPPKPVNLELPGMAVGYWANCDAFWPSLPEDAFVGLGNQHQVLLVVPSLSLVLVRMGGDLPGPGEDADEWRLLREVLFSPLARAFALGAPEGSQGAGCP